MLKQRSLPPKKLVHKDYAELKGTLLFIKGDLSFRLSIMKKSEEIPDNIPLMRGIIIGVGRE